ncbi:MAG: tRNA (guanosine(46)-N7)-methyltransferase TrmB [Planctomycetota bacterium]
MGKGLTRKKHLDPTGFGRDQDELPEIGSGPLDVRAWFGFEPWTGERNDPRPLEIELGSGKGTFLAQEAPLCPDTLYLGIEWASQFYRYAADRMRRLNLANVRMLHADGTVFIRNFVPDRSVSQLHWYFPDPWPKARHHKRRTFQEPFLRELHRVLTPATDEKAGRIRVATDHLDYWQWMQEHAARVADLYEIEPFERPASAGEGELVGTNFERKYRREGRTFNGMVLVKKG